MYLRPISIVLRQKFDKKNRELAKEEGSELIFGKFKSFKKIDNFIYSKIKLKDKILTIKSKYLVGADGATSSVRAALKKPYPESILTIYANIPNIDTNKCEFYFGKEFAPNEYAWVFPMEINFQLVQL